MVRNQASSQNSGIHFVDPRITENKRTFEVDLKGLGATNMERFDRAKELLGELFGGDKELEDSHAVVAILNSVLKNVVETLEPNDSVPEPSLNGLAKAPRGRKPKKGQVHQNLYGHSQDGTAQAA